MPRARRVCLVPGCPTLVPHPETRCPAHPRRSPVEDRRPNASQRGYGSGWRRVRGAFLARHKTCALCPAAATVADHHPVTRAELVRRGEQHPDAWQHLRPLCATCHNRHTATTSSGWGAT